MRCTNNLTKATFVHRCWALYIQVYSHDHPPLLCITLQLYICFTKHAGTGSDVTPHIDNSVWNTTFNQTYAYVALAQEISVPHTTSSHSPTPLSVQSCIQRHFPVLESNIWPWPSFSVPHSTANVVLATYTHWGQWLGQWLGLWLGGASHFRVRSGCWLTPSLPWCHLKTTTKSVKFDTFKPFFLLLGQWRG